MVKIAFVGNPGYYQFLLTASGHAQYGYPCGYR